jgi:hypothetical protein
MQIALFKSVMPQSQTVPKKSFLQGNRLELGSDQINLHFGAKHTSKLNQKHYNLQQAIKQADVEAVKQAVETMTPADLSKTPNGPGLIKEQTPETFPPFFFLLDQAVELGMQKSKLPETDIQNKLNKLIQLGGIMLKGGADINTFSQKDKEKHGIWHELISYDDDVLKPIEPFLNWMLKQKGVKQNLDRLSENNDQNADPNEPAVTRAVSYGNLPALRFLVAKGANINQPDEQGWTALNTALTLEEPSLRSRLIIELLKLGADWNKQHSLDESCKDRIIALAKVDPLLSQELAKEDSIDLDKILRDDRNKQLKKS